MADILNTEAVWRFVSRSGEWHMCEYEKHLEISKNVSMHVLNVQHRLVQFFYIIFVYCLYVLKMEYFWFNCSLIP